MLSTIPFPNPSWRFPSPLSMFTFAHCQCTPPTTRTQTSSACEHISEHMISVSTFSPPSSVSLRTALAKRTYSFARHPPWRNVSPEVARYQDAPLTECDATRTVLLSAAAQSALHIGRVDCGELRESKRTSSQAVVNIEPVRQQKASCRREGLKSPAVLSRVRTV